MGLAESKHYWDDLRRSCRTYRHDYGLSQKQLALELGVSQAAVSAFERGKSRTLRERNFDSLRKFIGKKGSRIVDFQQLRREQSPLADDTSTTGGALRNLQLRIAHRMTEFDPSEFENTLDVLRSMRPSVIASLYKDMSGG